MLPISQCKCICRYTPSSCTLSWGQFGSRGNYGCQLHFGSSIHTTFLRLCVSYGDFSPGGVIPDIVSTCAFTYINSVTKCSRKTHLRITVKTWYETRRAQLERSRISLESRNAPEPTCTTDNHPPPLSRATRIAYISCPGRPRGPAAPYKPAIGG